MGHGIDLLGTLLRIVPERRSPPVDVTAVKRVLIIKLSSLGDVVHALPVASALKEATPAIHVTWAVDDWAAPLLDGHGAIDRVLALPSLIRWPRRPVAWMQSAWRAFRELRRDRYDVVLDLQGLARSALVSLVARGSVRLARAGQREGAHLVSTAVPLANHTVHAVDEYLAVARHAGAATPGVPRFALAARPDAVRRIETHLAEEGIGPGDRLIVVAPSTSTRSKHWPFARWITVIDAVADTGRVVIIGTRGQRRRHHAIARGSRERPLDLTGSTAVDDVVALLQRATLLIAHDSGSAHIAAALGTPVVTIFGPTNPTRLAPYGQPERVVSHRDLCGRTCPAYCVHRYRCLDRATADEAIALARQVLDSPTPRRGTA